jgi:hypothetical protein
MTCTSSVTDTATMVKIFDVRFEKQRRSYREPNRKLDRIKYVIRYSTNRRLRAAKWLTNSAHYPPLDASNYTHCISACEGSSQVLKNPASINSRCVIALEGSTNASISLCVTASLKLQCMFV